MTSDRQNEIVLVVEDDPLLAATVRHRVERCWESACVQVAETVQEAADAWESLCPRLVLMDYRLPDGFGTDVVERMRTRGYRAPVVFMTAESESIGAEDCVRLAIAHVLSKPVEEDDLRAALSQTSVGWSGTRSRRMGRFRRIRLRGHLTGPRVGRLFRASGEEAWVVLEADTIGTVTEEAARGLCAWAGWLSARGGRLCLWPKTPAARQCFETRVGPFVGIVDDATQLQRESRRLTGAAERRALLFGASPDVGRRAPAET